MYSNSKNASRRGISETGQLLKSVTWAPRYSGLVDSGCPPTPHRSERYFVLAAYAGSLDISPFSPSKHSIYGDAPKPPAFQGALSIFLEQALSSDAQQLIVISSFNFINTRFSTYGTRIKRKMEDAKYNTPANPVISLHAWTTG